MTAPNESWCASLPVQPRIWDPTRLAAAMRCWRLHYHGTIQGYRGAGSIHTEFGSLYHGAVEAFDKRVLAGWDREEAILAGYKELLVATWDAEAGRPWGGEYI